MPEAPAPLAAALADRYRLERKLGEGGMATVYLADDLKHQRKVALKVLRPELAAILGAERFLHEIRTTANLQHPHILALHDSGQVENTVYYVMPFIEGESLRDRLTREKQLPIEDAVRIASQVASALDYAHRHGVIHRDIKPENILLHEGSALVADFGIALAASSTGGTRMTETGMSLGTPHYMSPEQAMGERDITARSDVYALGCVLYEMLTGEPPFTGPTAQAIVARVMTEDPRSLTAQRKTVPPHVEAAVFVALSKLPADRFGSAADFARGLGGDTPVPGRRGTVAERPRDRARSRGPAVLLGGLLLVLGGIATWALLRPARTGPVTWTSITLPAGLILNPSADPALALSPDGRVLAYLAEMPNGRRVVAIRRLEAPVPTPLAGTEDGSGQAFSPRGQWLAFLDATFRPRRIAAAGGAVTAIPAAPGVMLNVIRWASDSSFAVTLQNGDLGRLRPDGGVDTLLRVDRAAGEATLDVMQVLPGGAYLAIATANYPEGVLVVVDPDRPERTRIAGTPDEVNWAAYAEGVLAWSLVDGTLQAAPVDLKRRRLTGPAVPLDATAQTSRGFRPKVAASASALAFVTAPPPQLTLVDRAGSYRPLLATPRTFHNPRVSPDGRRILVDITETERDVWAYSVADTTLTRVTFEGSGHDAYWLPDGHDFTYAVANRGAIGIFRKAVDGGGSGDSVAFSGVQVSVHAVTPDGRTAVVARISGFLFDLDTMRFDDPQHVLHPYLTTRYNESWPALSPDGRWLAYVTDESNRSEVYVRPFRSGGPRVLVSQSGGSEPIWSRDGRELFYVGTDGNGPKLMAARVATGPEFRVLARSAMFDANEFEGATPHANYDVMPDGRHFVMVRQGRFNEVSYVANWGALARSRGAP